MVWERRLERAILSAAAVGARHWLLLLNVALGIFVALPLLAPLLMAQGHTQAAGTIYSLYRVTCHQEPYRSYFLAGPRMTYSKAELEALTPERPLAAFVGSPQMGYKMAYCERDAATYAVLLLAGLGFGLVRRRLPRLQQFSLQRFLPS